MANKNFMWEGRVTSSQDPLYEYYPGKKIISDNADEVVKYLQEDKSNTAYIKINSRGGAVYEAKAIVSKLQPYKSRVEFEIVGFAASASSYIPLATANKIYIREGSTLMIHEPRVTNIAPMTIDQLKKDIEALSLINDNLVDVISKRSKLTEAETRKALKEETEYSAEKALELGLVDEILEPDDASKEATENYKNQSENHLKVFLNYLEDKEMKATKASAEETQAKIDQEEILQEEAESEVNNETPLEVEPEKEILVSDKTIDSLKNLSLNEAKTRILTLENEIERLKEVENEYFEFVERNRTEKNEQAISDALARRVITKAKAEEMEAHLKSVDESSASILRDYLRNLNSDVRMGSKAKRFSDFSEFGEIPTSRLQEYKELKKSKEDIAEIEEMRRKMGVN